MCVNHRTYLLYPVQFQPLPTKVESNKSEPEQPQLMTDRERPSRERSDRRSEKFVPAESEREGFNKPHYNGRGGGRPKPTKGSEIQLNIFSLVQVNSSHSMSTKQVRFKLCSQPRTCFAGLYTYLVYHIYKGCCGFNFSSYIKLSIKFPFFGHIIKSPTNVLQ